MAQKKNSDSVKMPPPSQFMLQIRSRRLASAIQVRPTEEQMAALVEIEKAEKRKDETVTQADIVRAALDFFIAAWQQQNKSD